MKTIAKTLLGTLIIATTLVALPALAAIEGKEVTYNAGETKLKGYLAWDNALKGKVPGVLVVHEWWGHNDYARKRARMLAELGYVALAVDMYGDGKQASHPKEAGMFAAMVNKSKGVSEARFNAAADFLKIQPQTDATRLAAIGYCFGGGVVLHMARSGADLKGVASFHGSLATDTPSVPGAIKGRIFVANGAADSFTPPEVVGAFASEMAKAEADFRFFNYDGALHSFTNPDADEYAKRFDMPIAYNAAADQRSWDELKRFLREIFAQ